MAIIKKVGKKLKKAKKRRKTGRGRGETLIVPRYTTMPVGMYGPQMPGGFGAPTVPRMPGMLGRQIFVLESEEVRGEGKRRKKGEKVTEKELSSEGRLEKAAEEMEKKIREKIKESPFKLQFETLNIEEVKKRRKGRKIRKEFRPGAVRGDQKKNIDLLKKINRVIPLITVVTEKEKKVISYAHIKWNPETQSLLYTVHEPELDEEDKSLITELKNLLREKLDVDFEKIRGKKSYNYIITEFNKLAKKIGIKFTPEQRIKFNYYVYRDLIGLGKIEPLMKDPDIEDISCVGYGIPIFIYHRDPLFNQIATDIVFDTKKELDNFVMRLAQKSGKNLTLAKPLMEGALPDGSRVQATLGTEEIARRGSNFTIRKFTTKPLTPTDLMDYKTVNPDILAYLWFAIENNMSTIVAGATATGKTSFLNAASLFIKPEFKIISIEDTPELRLPHPDWIAEVARPGFGGRKYGEVTMYQLLKSGLRQRPDYIIVGEVRGEEASVMFQGMATGHPGLGTIHADNMPAVVDRLTNKPIDLPKPMLENLDIIIFLEKFKSGGRMVRKVKEIVEIVGYDYNNKELVTNSAFKYNPRKNDWDSFESVILDKIRTRGGYTLEQLKKDIQRRIKLLKYLRAKEVTDYRVFNTYIVRYYNDPSYVDELPEI